ncbi:MAG: PLDc N-terminal domain-containing protein [Actinobacteria bacterium]|nr:PLDc N-terminal domain-containing protein [Actinomycetota bacterium]
MPSLGGWEWIIIFVLPMILFICAMVSIAKHRAASGTEKVLWVLVSLIFPILGPILWFAIGKKSSNGAATQA